MTQSDQRITWGEYFTWLGIVVAVVATALLSQWLIWIAGGCLLLVGAVALWRCGCKKVDDILPRFREED